MTRTGLSNEMIAILAVGVMLAGLGLTIGSWIRDDMQILRDDMRGDMQILRDEVRTVQSGLSELRERVIRIESLLQEDSIGRRG